VDLTGKTVVHTTSAGTQGIANAKSADQIITGSLVNASAIVEYIRRENPETVSLVCMGLNCLHPIEEDTLCAEYIKAELEGTSLPDLEERIYDLRNTSGAKFFDESRPEFPERDFHLSVALNTCPFVLRLVKNPEGLDYMERVDVL
jgi:2-phosphosulfolactate phosphatase